MAYEAGLQVDPSSDVLKKGMAEVEKAMKSEMGSSMGPHGPDEPDVLRPGLMASSRQTRRLRSTSKTRPLFKRFAAFGRRRVQAGHARRPENAHVLGVAMGVDIVSLGL